MDKAAKGWTLKELASVLGGVLEGPPELRIVRPTDAGADDPFGLAFAQSEEFLKKIETSKIGAALIERDARPIDKPVIRVDRPREAFAAFLGMCQSEIPLNDSIHPTAIIDPTASVSESARIGPYVVIERDAVVKSGARIYAFAYIGENCIVGEDAAVYPHAVLFRDVELRERCIIHSHAIVGADGFGFTWNGQRHIKIPQVGRAIIGADAEIGASTSVDRAMIGATVIGDGAKLDNQVQIGHNCTIGKHTVVAAQVGVSGSCNIGDRCTLAGQVGLADHVTLGNDVILTGRAATTKDILEPGPYRGAPATPYQEELRFEASLRKVPDLIKRVRELEKKLAQLEAK